jgi:hypothetical protein
MIKLFEDPFYDEDGVLIDEDFDEFEDPTDYVSEMETYSPFDTVNS